MVFKLPMGADLTKVRCTDKNEARENLGLSAETQLLGYELGTGTFDEYVDLVLTSFREVLKKRPGIKMAFIGDFKGLSQRIRSKCARSGLDRQTIFSGSFLEEHSKQT